MLKKQQEATPNGIYGLVAEVIEAPEHYEKALTAVLGDRLQYVIVKSHQEGVEAIEYLKNQASGRGSFIPLELSRKPQKELAARRGRSDRAVDGHDLGQRRLSRCRRVSALRRCRGAKICRPGLSLWNRNGYYSTLVTPEGEVIDPMGTVTGGSGAPLEASFLTQRRRIRELSDILAERRNQLGREEHESDQAQTRTGAGRNQEDCLGAEIHRLEIERVRLEHENRAAEQERERLTQTVRALTQEQTDLTTDGPAARRGNSALLRAACRSRTEEKTDARTGAWRKNKRLGELQPIARSRRSGGDPVAHSQRSLRRKTRQHSRESRQSAQAAGRNHSRNRGAPRTYRRFSTAPTGETEQAMAQHRRSRSENRERNFKFWKSGFRRTARATGRSLCSLAEIGETHQRAQAAAAKLARRKRTASNWRSRETAARAAASGRQLAGKIRCRSSKRCRSNQPKTSFRRKQI